LKHLCVGLDPIPGSRFSRPCRRQVRSALGRCENHRPEAERPPVDPEDQRRWNRAARERRDRTAGLPPAMEVG
jgi:hypothetical protein